MSDVAIPAARGYGRRTYHGEDMNEEQEHTPFPHDCEDCDGRGEVLPHWSLDHADAVPCWCVKAEETFTPVDIAKGVVTFALVWAMVAGAFVL